MWCKEPTQWKRSWCWEMLRSGEEVTQNAMVGWHHWLNGHEFEQIPGDSKAQGSLACCSPCSCKGSDATLKVNKNKSNLPWFRGWPTNIPVFYAILFFITSNFTFITTCTTEHCFCFSLAASFFLELFSHSSPIACWTLDLWKAHLLVLYLCTFSYCSWGFWGKNTGVVCHVLLW